MRRTIAILTAAGLLAFLAASSVSASASDDGEEDDAKLIGIVESLPGTPDLVGDWVVSGVTVHVTAGTEVEHLEQISVGATVEVEGWTELDGSIAAHEVELREDAEDDRYGEMKLWGFVEALPGTPDLVGDWVISGVTVHVTTATEIETEHGPVAVGSAVEIEGLAEADGSITAREIETRSPDDVDADAVLLRGTAGSFPGGDRVGTWKVSRHAVRVRPDTVIVRERLLRRGANVRVVGILRADGTIRAEKVAVRAS